jgi:LAGLIDADG endonuclease
LPLLPPTGGHCEQRKKEEIRLNFQIDQKKDVLLLIIKNFLGGNIGYRKSQGTYYYGSTSFGSAKNVVNYFDYFHLLSSKHINYLK